ncbi:acyl-CoA dehydrogenase family protein [Pseudonocardia sp. WMMC193]|uniref:acyl-CoA dehydrogenase family protein n=1 Tax=Pseudonocardia sp. WMMC193 TaxID=2911965 RepID=UPI001F2B0F1F|nr:acyl-CoA dehydrogenase family protein [Pseudonocardia sp. WMMC193]MCF7549552.1 acyl-CoA dehydrogenase family protein [Pseudonocardia sp. WMMC193]
MDFTLTAEQDLLRRSLADYLAEHYDLHDSRVGWRPQVWRAFADDLGILGAALPEEGGGPVETMVVAEELGRALVVEPFVDTVVLGGGVLRRAGAHTELKGIVDGSVRIATALGADVTARDGGLSGSAAVVVGFPQATHLLVDTGDALFLTATDASGLTAHPYRTIDDRHAADLELVGVRATELDRSALAPALDEATAAVCAEAVGCMRKVLADTIAYTKERKQFGQPIGSFQVLQHRMVDMDLELELAVSAVYRAFLAPEPERPKAVSAAKVTVARAARFVGQSAVQLHGGMGMTQELAIGHYFKRLTAFEYEYGTADTHRARYQRQA